MYKIRRGSVQCVSFCDGKYPFRVKIQTHSLLNTYLRFQWPHTILYRSLLFSINRIYIGTVWQIFEENQIKIDGAWEGSLLITSWSTKHVPTWVLPFLCLLYWAFSSVPVWVPFTMAGKALSDHVKRQKQHKLKEMHMKVSGNRSRLGMIIQFQPRKQSVRDWKWLELGPKTYQQSQRDLQNQSQW